MEISKKSPRRDLSVEVLRLIGMLLVIGIHVRESSLLPNGHPSWSRTMISCLVSDGVTVFWMILGFFYFKGKSYRKMVSGMARKILLPLMLLYLFLFLFQDAVFHGQPLSTALKGPADWINFLRGNILILQPMIPQANHTWYMLVYILIILLFPAFWGVRQYLKTEKSQVIFLLAIFAIVGVNDYMRNMMFEFSAHSLIAVAGAAPAVFLGDYLYAHRERFYGKWKAAGLGICLIAAVQTVRFLVQMNLYRTSEDLCEHPLFWYTDYALLDALGLFLLVFGLSGHIRIPEKMQSVLAHAGRRTYEIYLVHWPLKNLLYYNGVFDDISRKISGLGSGWLYNITREVLLILLVLAVSVPVAELIVLAGRLAGGLFRKKTA